MLAGGEWYVLVAEFYHVVEVGECALLVFLRLTELLYHERLHRRKLFQLHTCLLIKKILYFFLNVSSGPLPDDVSLLVPVFHFSFVFVF